MEKHGVNGYKEKDGYDERGGVAERRVEKAVLRGSLCLKREGFKGRGL